MIFKWPEEIIKLWLQFIINSCAYSKSKHSFENMKYFIMVYVQLFHKMGLIIKQSIFVRSNNLPWYFLCISSVFCFRFFIINVAIVYIYYNTFQKVDEEEYGGLSEILKEGLLTSFSSFLVSITFSYCILFSEIKLIWYFQKSG